MTNNFWWIHKTVFTRPTWEIFTGRSIKSKTIARNKNIIRGRNDGCDNKQCNGGSGWETQHVANVSNALQHWANNVIQCNAINDTVQHNAMYHKIQYISMQHYITMQYIAMLIQCNKIQCNAIIALCCIELSLYCIAECRLQCNGQCNTIVLQCNTIQVPFLQERSMWSGKIAIRRGRNKSRRYVAEILQFLRKKSYLPL